MSVLNGTIGKRQRNGGMSDFVEKCATSRQRLIHVLEDTGLVSESLATSGTKRCLLCMRQGFFCFWHEMKKTIGLNGS